MSSGGLSRRRVLARWIQRGADAVGKDHCGSEGIRRGHGMSAEDGWACLGRDVHGEAPF